MARSKTQANSFAWNETIQKMSAARANTDASPLTDDLDDATIHEPMTKESDMNEARASERADLVELRRLIAAASDLPWNVGNSPHAIGQHIYTLRAACVADTCKPTFPDTECRSNAALIVAACNALPGLIAEVERLTQERDGARAEVRKEVTSTAELTDAMINLRAENGRLRAELSRASATAQEPADTKAVMDEFATKLEAVLAYAFHAGAVDVGLRGMVIDAAQPSVIDLRQFIQRLIPAPASSADTPKCVTCAAKIDPERFIREAADKAAVWSSDCRNIRVLPMSTLDTILITLDAMQNHSKPYEDSPACTPASAEQAKP